MLKASIIYYPTEQLIKPFRVFRAFRVVRGSLPLFFFILPLLDKFLQLFFSLQILSC